MKRPKLSLEPDHQVRREPPQGFTSLEGTAPDAAQGPSDAARPSKAPDPGDDGPSEATGSAPAREPDVLSTRPPPSPSPTAPRPAPASADSPPPRKTHLDGATPAAAQGLSEAARHSKATGSAPALEPAARSTRPLPSPSPTPSRPAQSAAQPPPRKARFDGATIGKILLAVGIAALSILLLKRRFL